jgi:hypothetical protein
MAKRLEKAVVEEREVAAAGYGDPVAMANVPEPAPMAKAEQFRMGEWRGFSVWRCELCPWDTMDGEQAMRVHLATVHAPPKRLVVAYDARGDVLAG